MNTEDNELGRENIPAIPTNSPAIGSMTPGLLSLPSSREEIATPHPAEMATPHSLPESEEPPQTGSGIPVSILTESGQFAPEWWTRYDDLLEMGKTLKKFKSPDALAKSYTELEKLRSYPDPEDEAKMSKFRSFLGLPDQSEYKITPPELQEGLEECWNTELAEKIASTAYKYAIPPVALQAVANVFADEQIRNYGEHLQHELQQWSAQKEENAESLKNLWGAKYQNRLSGAAHTLRQICQEADISPEALVNDPVIGSHPEFIRLLDHVGRLLSDSPLKGAEKSAASSQLSEAHRMESDPSHPLHEAYMNHNHPDHDYANSIYDKAFLNR